MDGNTAQKTNELRAKIMKNRRSDMSDEQFGFLLDSLFVMGYTESEENMNSAAGLSYEDVWG